MPPTSANAFSVNMLARSAGVSRQRFLAVLRAEGGDPVAALVRLGENRASAELLVLSSRLAGPDRDYAAEYARRQARGRRLGARSAREGAGHRAEPLAPAGITAMFEGRGFAMVENPTLAERRRINRWNAYAAHLDAGNITPERFRRLIRSWRPLRGERFESDPEVVLATLTARREAGEEVYEYPGRRS